MENQKVNGPGCQHRYPETIAAISAACKECAPAEEWRDCPAWQAVAEVYLPPLVQNHDMRWGRAVLADVVRADAIVAQGLARETCLAGKSKRMQFPNLLRQAAARAVERRIVQELLGNPSSAYWDVVYAMTLALACRLKGLVPGTPTAADFKAGTWLKVVLGGRADKDDELYDAIMDVTTEVCKKVRKHLVGFRGESRLDVWAATIVRRTFIDRFRRRARREGAVRNGQQEVPVVRQTVYLSQGDRRHTNADGKEPSPIDPPATYDVTDHCVSDNEAWLAYYRSVAEYAKARELSQEDAATTTDIFYRAWHDDRPHREIAEAHDGYDENRVNDELTEFRYSPQGGRLWSELKARKRNYDAPREAQADQAPPTRKRGKRCQT